MISFLRGILFEINQESIIVDVNGVGYEVIMPERSLNRMSGKGDEIFVYTYMQVLENEFKLYGFMGKGELGLFKMLLGVSGIGAKGALSVLSAIEPAGFYQAIASQDEKTLTKIPGIGKKTAQRLMFELKDKISAPAILTQVNGAGDNMLADVLEALETLGYSRSETLSIIMDLKGKGQLSESVEGNIKKVLQIRAMQMRKSD